MQHIETVFKRLRQHALTINSSKCVFGQQEVIYLGYSITPEGYKPPGDTVQALFEFPKRNTIEQLRRFLGIMNFHLQSIPHAAELQDPLNELLKGTIKKDKRQVPWNTKSDDAFIACKNSLALVTLMNFPYPNARMPLTTDASDVAIGACLMQLVNNVWQPIGLFSRKLTDTERHYTNPSFTPSNKMLIKHQTVNFDNWSSFLNFRRRLSMSKLRITQLQTLSLA